jgi:hypothetical protein
VTIVEAKELFLTNNSIMQKQLLSICGDLTDEQVRFAHEAIDDRGLSNVVVHLYWSIINRSRALNGLDRAEPPQPPQTTAELVAFINDTHRQANELIGRISEDRLKEVVKLPYAELPGATAMLEGFAHAFRHVGNVLDARHLGGFETHALG